MNIPIITTSDPIVRYVAHEHVRSLVLSNNMDVENAGERFRYSREYLPNEYAVFVDPSSATLAGGHWNGLILEVYWHCGHECFVIECHVSVASGPQKRFAQGLQSDKDKILKLIGVYLKLGYDWLAGQDKPSDFVPIFETPMGFSHALS